MIMMIMILLVENQTHPFVISSAQATKNHLTKSSSEMKMEKKQRKENLVYENLFKIKTNTSYLL